MVRSVVVGARQMDDLRAMVEGDRGLPQRDYQFSLLTFAGVMEETWEGAWVPRFPRELPTREQVGLGEPAGESTGAEGAR